MKLGKTIGVGSRIIFPLTMKDKTVKRTRGTVIGKILGADAYVVYLNFGGENGPRMLTKKKYGCPIRHIELEWGNFNGMSDEYVVPRDAFELYDGV